MSKIQIWKRITTDGIMNMRYTPLYLICQRYKFESESQQRVECKAATSAVFNMSKIQIWKRITTCRSSNVSRYKLYLICQRYKFESESQLSSKAYQWVTAVFNMSKIQIWKRITTDEMNKELKVKLYLICQRYKFESESQLIFIYNLDMVCCI